jgi:hypothetical protein
MSVLHASVQRQSKKSQPIRTSELIFSTASFAPAEHTLCMSTVHLVCIPCQQPGCVTQVSYGKQGGRLSVNSWRGVGNKLPAAEI